MKRSGGSLSSEQDQDWQRILLCFPWWKLIVQAGSREMRMVWGVCEEKGWSLMEHRNVMDRSVAQLDDD